MLDKLVGSTKLIINGLIIGRMLFYGFIVFTIVGVILAIRHFFKNPLDSVGKLFKMPDYKCDKGYELEGIQCIKEPPKGYKRNPGDLVAYYRIASESEVIKSKEADQDNSACKNLKTVVHGVGTCTGTDPVVCKTSGCGCIKKKAERYCKTKDSFGTCWSWGTRCPSGLRSDGISCWEDAKTKCTGKGVVTRKAPRSCPDGYSFDKADPEKIGLCFKNCPDGYERRPGDIVSCWNKNPLSKTISPNDIKPAKKKKESFVEMFES